MSLNTSAKSLRKQSWYFLLETLSGRSYKTASWNSREAPSRDGPMQNPTRQTQKRGILWNGLFLMYVYCSHTYRSQHFNRVLSNQQKRYISARPQRPSCSRSNNAVDRLECVSQYFGRRHVANVQLQSDWLEYYCWTRIAEESAEPARWLEPRDQYT